MNVSSRLLCNFNRTTPLNNPLVVIPSNLQLGLVGMGQAILYKASAMAQDLMTFGCGPCIGIALNCSNGSRLLAHLQPEVDLDEFVQEIANNFPDEIQSDTTLYIVTAQSSEPGTAQKQMKMVTELCRILNNKFEYTVFDDDNVKVFYDKDSIRLNRNGSINFQVGGSFVFENDALEYMKNQMIENSKSVRIFLMAGEGI